MSRKLCRVDRKSSIVLAEDGSGIRLERKGETQFEWLFDELDRIQVVPPKSMWSAGYVRFIRSGQPIESNGKYSPHADPDAVVIVDASSLQAGAVLLRQMGAELGVVVIADGVVDEPEDAESPIRHSVRTKKGDEIVRLTDSSIALDNGRVKFETREIDEIRVKISTFGTSFIQLVPKGTIEAWPKSVPDAEFPTAVDISSVWGSESWKAFLQLLETLYPDRLVRLDKQAEREASLGKLHALSEKTTGERVYWSSASNAFGINVYSREVWLGDPFLKSSIGGPIAGVRAEYSVSGNIITSTRTIRSMAGSTHVQSPQDERIFQLAVNGPRVSIAATASADEVSDSDVVQLVNAINAAGHSALKATNPAGASGQTTMRQGNPVVTEAEEATKPSNSESSEGLRRLMKLYAAGLIDEDEFAQGRADLS